MAGRVSMLEVAVMAAAVGLAVIAFQRSGSAGRSQASLDALPQPAAATVSRPLDVAVAGTQGGVRSPSLPRASEPRAGGPALRLYAIRSTGSAAAAAIIADEQGRQAVYRLGEPLPGGWRLTGLKANSVEATRGAARTTLTFAPDGGPTGSGLDPINATPRPAAAAGAETLAPASQVTPNELIAGALFLPRSKEGSQAGYEVVERGRGGALRRAGLRTGDVILAVDGSELNAERRSELAGILTSASDVVLRIERAGKIMDVRVGQRPGAPL